MARGHRLLFRLLGVILLAGAPGLASATDPAVTARLLISNPAPYVGEPIVLGLEIRYRQHPGGRAALTWPQFDQVLAADPASSRSARWRNASGYIVETLQRQLRPLQAGPLRLDGARLSFGGQAVPVRGVSLHVRPLPQQGQPAGFGSLVGDYRLQLLATGRGTREIVVSIVDASTLGARPEPTLRPGAGEQLILLASDVQPAGEQGRQHRWRYLYLPAADDAAGALSVALPVFDPASGRYQILGAALSPAAGSPRRPGALPVLTPLLAILPAILLLYGLYRWRCRPRRLNTCLQHLLGRSPAGLSRQAILARLDERLDPRSREALIAYWHLCDRSRFSPAPALPGAAAAEKDLCRRLRKVIDKKRPIP